MAGAPQPSETMMQPWAWKPHTKDGRMERLALDYLPQVSFKNLTENKLLLV